MVDIEQFAFAVQDVERILNGDIQHVGVFHRICGEESEASDVMLAVGTTLQVYPVAGLVPTAKAAGARIIIINGQPTPFDNIADAVFNEPISDVLPKLVE